MTQKDKELLLKDLSTRLPYGVKVAFFNEDLTYHSEPKTLIQIECINNLNYSRLEDKDGNSTIIEFVKPYLFPMLSMTDEQYEEYHNTCNVGLNRQGDEVYYNCDESIDWLNANHIDYRGLIEKGLAIDATGLNIY